MKFWIVLLAWFGRSLSFIVQLLPFSAQKALGALIGILWFDVFRIRRKVVLHNLEIAFPELSSKQRQNLGRKSLIHFGLNLIEYTSLPFMDIEWVKKKCRFEGLEHLDRALEQKKGVCLLTLHLGHGDLAISSLSLLNYPITLISKEFSLKVLNELWFGMRRKMGTKFIPPRNSSLAVSRALKSNEVVIFVLDQFTGPPIGTRSKFFGVETGTGLGLATMAKRRGSPVIPCYTFRDASGIHHLQFEEAFPSIDDNDSLQALTQAYNDRLEVFVRRHPEQWMWIHRRWKKFNDPDQDRGTGGSQIGESKPG